MSQLLEELREEFSDEDSRYTYVEAHLNASVAAQIKTFRGEMSQQELAEKTGTKQSGISRLENANYSAWKVETLRKLARAFGLRLHISFEEFGTLAPEIENFKNAVLKKRKFGDDPAFKEPTEREKESVAVADLQGIATTKSDSDLSWLGNSMEAANKAITAYAAQRSQEYSVDLARGSASSPDRVWAFSPVRKGHSRRHSVGFKASLRSSKVISISKSRPKRKRVGSYRLGIGNLKGQYGTPKAS